MVVLQNPPSFKTTEIQLIFTTEMVIHDFLSKRRGTLCKLTYFEYTENKQHNYANTCYKYDSYKKKQ